MDIIREVFSNLYIFYSETKFIISSTGNQAVRCLHSLTHHAEFRTGNVVYGQVADKAEQDVQSAPDAQVTMCLYYPQNKVTWVETKRSSHFSVTHNTISLSQIIVYKDSGL